MSGAFVADEHLGGYIEHISRLGHALDPEVTARTRSLAAGDLPAEYAAHNHYQRSGLAFRRAPV